MEEFNFNVEKKEFVFKEPVKRNSHDNIAIWEFTGDMNEIDELTKSCGCTVPIINGNKISATYRAGNNPSKFSQKVTVWMKDGEDLKKLNPLNGQMMFNMDKAHIDLFLSGEIV